MMKKWLFISLFCFSLPLFAQVNIDPLLNKVMLQLKTEQWVTTKTAEVNVAINASVTAAGVAQMQNDVLAKLSKISNQGQWHIVSFDRREDQSGLETLQLSAQARLPQAALANLRQLAKSISKPGETYTIESVNFNPSRDELRQANIELRDNLYQQAKAELDRLNKMFPEQKFYLHQIDFMFVQPMLAANNLMRDKSIAMANMPTSAPLSVGNKVEISATVVLASLMPLPITKLVP